MGIRGAPFILVRRAGLKVVLVVFLSYQFRERDLADQLAARLLCSNAPLDDYDQRMRAPVDSEPGSAARNRITQAISQASSFVCIVGPTTATSSWVDWEIESALSARKPLFVIRRDEADALPRPLTGLEFTLLPADVDSAAEVLRT